MLDSELARRAARGEPAAAAELLASIRPGVVRYCCWAHLGSLGHSAVSPDDVAQEVCLAVFEALTAVPGPRAAVVAATAPNSERLLDDTEASSWHAAPGTGNVTVELAVRAPISSVQVSA